MDLPEIDDATTWRSRCISWLYELTGISWMLHYIDQVTGAQWIMGYRGAANDSQVASSKFGRKTAAFFFFLAELWCCTAKKSV